MNFGRRDVRGRLNIQAKVLALEQFFERDYAKRAWREDEGKRVEAANFRQTLNTDEVSKYFDLFDRQEPCSMNSSPTPSSPEPLLVAEGGVSYTRQHKDPFAAWVELMEVVEALCPKWPEREHRIEGVFLL